MFLCGVAKCVFTFSDVCVLSNKGLLSLSPSLPPSLPPLFMLLSADDPVHGRVRISITPIVSPPGSPEPPDSPHTDKEPEDGLLLQVQCVCGPFTSACVLLVEIGQFLLVRINNGYSYLRDEMLYCMKDACML